MPGEGGRGNKGWNACFCLFDSGSRRTHKKSMNYNSSRRKCLGNTLFLPGYISDTSGRARRISSHTRNLGRKRRGKWALGDRVSNQTENGVRSSLTEWNVMYCVSNCDYEVRTEVYIKLASLSVDPIVRGENGISFMCQRPP